MKTIAYSCILIVSLLLYACQPTPQTLAEKYMALTCAAHHSQNDLDKAKTDKERARLQTRCDRIHNEMEKINAQILENFQDDEKAMKIIQKIAENYQCEEN